MSADTHPKSLGFLGSLGAAAACGGCGGMPGASAPDSAEGGFGEAFPGPDGRPRSVPAADVDRAEGAPACGPALPGRDAPDERLPTFAVDKRALEPIAASLEYPHAHGEKAARQAAECLASSHPVVARAFFALADWLTRTSVDDAEETYTALFDLRPSCTLHIGYHVYGENYQRGILLAGLVRELEDAGVDKGTELPDFLPTVLRLLARLPEGEGRDLLCARIVAPGVSAMKRELGAVDTPWARAVSALSGLFVFDEEQRANSDTLKARVEREVSAHA